MANGVWAEAIFDQYPVHMAIHVRQLRNKTIREFVPLDAEESEAHQLGRHQIPLHFSRESPFP